MVSDPYGFTDSPDAEFIASGINMKSPEAVAIGRQGNFLLWGFYTGPSDLTPEARKCLVNAICYIRKFDGQRPLVQKVRGRLARQWALVYAYSYKVVSDRESFLRSQPEAVRSDPDKVADLHRAKVQHYRDQFPEGLRQELGDDPGRYVEYYRSHLEFLRPKERPGFPFAVDEDVRGLGLSNRKVELLDKCVSMLEQGDRPDLASRILKRYTTEDFTDAKGWRSWLEAHRDRLFFTDVGGFKYLVPPENLVRAASRPGQALTQESDGEHPVVTEAELTPGKVRGGEALDLIVRVRMAPTWHIYAVGGSKGPGIATSLKLRLRGDLEAEGEWSYPEWVRGSDGQMVHEGSVEFRRKLRVKRDAARGPIRVACEFGYQACDPHSCRPPTIEELEAGAEVSGPAAGK